MYVHIYFFVIAVVILNLVGIFIFFLFLPINLQLFVSGTKCLSYMCTNMESIAALQ